MSRIVSEGDRVYNPETDVFGEVQTVYPEVNIAIVRTYYGCVKMKLDEIVVMSEPETPTEPETKKKTLLEKIKGTFLRGSYD